ncbi:MAG: Lar family restriction alleviation protein [Bacilli bacterium]|nr:Lar family restriction alleviation protein [Bacilli bacterium]
MENIKAKVKYEAIKACPICGNIPHIEKESMDRGNGHGYPGCYEYIIKCSVCGYPTPQSCSTIYIKSHEEAKAEVIKYWNTEVRQIEAFLKHKYE